MLAPLERPLSDEVWLRILAYLPASDLAHLQSVHSTFLRLGVDGLLWKRLYYRDFVLPSLHPSDHGHPPVAATKTPTLAGLRSLLLRQHLGHLSSRHPSSNSDGRRIRRLPTRFHTDRTTQPTTTVGTAPALTQEQADSFINGSHRETLRNDGLDWKALYQVTLNWSTGRFRVTELDVPPHSANLPCNHLAGTDTGALSALAPPCLAPPSSVATDAARQHHATAITPDNHPSAAAASTSTLVEASPNLIFTANRRASERPTHSTMGTVARDHLGVDVFLAHGLLGDARQTSEPLSAHRRPHDPTQNRPLATLLPPSILLERWSASGVDIAEVELVEMRLDASDMGRDMVDSAAGTAKGKRKASTEAHSAGDREAAMAHGVRLLMAYSTGDFSVARVCARPHRGSFRLEVYEELTHIRSPRTADAPGKGCRIVATAFHSPVLVTCTEDFGIGIFRIVEAPSGGAGWSAELVQHMSSYRSCWPACLRLKPLPYYDARKRPRQQQRGRAPAAPSSSKGDAPEDERSGHDRGPAFRLTIAYSTPAYPASWTIGVQEVVLFLPAAASGPASTAVRITSRHATAKHAYASTPIDPRGTDMFRRVHAPDGLRDRRLPWSDARSRPVRGPDLTALRPRSPAPAANRFTSISYDDPFVVLGAADNLLEVFELVGATTHVREDALDDDDGDGGGAAPLPRARRPATATSTSTRGTLALIHRSVLHGHTGSVLSVALEDGRCVSGSSDGSVMVWSLGERFDDADSIASVLLRRTRRGASDRRRVRQQARSSVQAGSERTASRDRSARTDESGSQRDGTDNGADVVAMRHIVTLRAHPSAATLQPIFEGDDEAQEEEDGIAGEQPIDRGGSGDAPASPPSPHRFAPSHTSTGPATAAASLGQILAEAQRTSSATTPQTAIRWVSTAFDKIVSVMSTVPSTSSGETRDQTTSARDERVQIWDFAR
ncbi:uncharacterized protein PFL1_04276 [Pseudozyma flocculosa PF-1]|uniref:F-box domain-containing protein n=2 Tax=Pseudozyma flocculosa TaxID=84751 RepID=A0A5C3FFF7_9BASI|nr:uncharacterized protein PFL1_04276 [Pseudozyma flocculosa PF-1]EPQ27949.1 hypothetical protein PFL1_04276 [Pseudozyma flocculosa PF-1]SPO42241.1 uncharacterized protein PSFLO_07724 [Pseudozyma flocculosa]